MFDIFFKLNIKYGGLWTNSQIINIPNQDSYYIHRLIQLFLIIPGYNVAQRRRKRGVIGFQHRLTKDDAMKWFQHKYDGVILNAKKI